MNKPDLSKPLEILVIEGLTMPEALPEYLQDIALAAPPGSTVQVAHGIDDARSLAADVDVILGLLDRRLFLEAPRLKWVHAIASGVDMFMFEEFIESDVLLTGEKGLVGGHLAETGFGLLLSLTRQIHPALVLGADGWTHRAELRAKQIELTDRTMGIIGFGGTGRAMAQRAAGFDMNVIAVDRFPPAGPVDPRHGATEVWSVERLNDLLAQSDVVAVCCPLSDETRSMLDAEALTKMKSDSYLINVTRGEVVDTDALVDSLRSGHLAGAALDVVADEPLAADHPLFSLDNVAMTPHTAGGSNRRARRNIDRFVRNLGHAQTGHQLEGVVDKTLGF